MAAEKTMTLGGIYTRPYSEIVRPGQVWTVTKYFLGRWTPYLTPSQAWLIIGARQLSYLNRKRPWFTAYDRRLADAAGVHVKVYRRTLKKAIAAGDGPLAAFLTQEGQPLYRREGPITRQTETRYTIRLDDPLTPGDTAALAYWLRRNSPPLVTVDAVIALLNEACQTPRAELLAADIAPVDGAPAALPAARDVVAHVFPSLAADAAWQEAADALHSHLIAPEHAHLETQYFRSRWLTELGPGPALLLTYLRSLGYHNESSGETRDTVLVHSGELEARLQISSRTLSRWVKLLETAVPGEGLERPFITTLDSRKLADQRVATTYRINLRTPVAPADIPAYHAALAALPAASQVSFNGTRSKALTGESDKKFPTQHLGDGQDVPHTLSGAGQEVPHSSGGDGQIVADSATGDGQEVPHTAGGDGQKVPGSPTKRGAFKYYEHLFQVLSWDDDVVQIISTWPPQHAWRLDQGGAQEPLAAAAAKPDWAALLDRWGVQGTSRRRLLAYAGQPETAVAWYLFALAEPGLKQPVNYLIRRIQAGDPPPKRFVHLALLSWEAWRSYAAAWAARPWLTTDQWAALAAWPSFELWGDIYGGEQAEQLPFGVGEGLAALAGRLARRPATAPPVADGAVVWQAALADLRGQMTRATFDTWLRDTVWRMTDGDTFIIAVRGAAAQAWLSARLADQVAAAVTAVVGRSVGVRFVLLDGPGTENAPPDGARDDA